MTGNEVTANFLLPPLMIWFWLMVSIKDCELVTRPIWSQKMPLSFIQLFLKTELSGEITLSSFSTFVGPPGLCGKSFWRLFKSFQRFLGFSRPQPGKATLYVWTEWGIMYWNQFYIEQLSFIHPVASVANKLQLFKAFQGSQPGKATLCVYRMRSWQVKYVESMPTSIRDGS